MSELIYIYSFYNNLEINLSIEFDISFSAHTLTIKKNKERVINGFWGEKVSNMTVFAGKNKVGKTRLVCETILNFDLGYSYGIACIKTNGKINIFHSPNLPPINIKNHSGFKYFVEEVKSEPGRTNLAKTNIQKIFYSNQINGYNVDLISNIHSNISTYYLLTNHPNETYTTNFDNVGEHERNEIKRQIKFLDSEFPSLIEDFSPSVHAIDFAFRNHSSQEVDFYSTKYFMEVISFFQTIEKDNNFWIDLKSTKNRTILISVFFANYYPNFNNSPLIKKEIIDILNKATLNDNLIDSLSKGNRSTVYQDLINLLIFIDKNLDQFIDISVSFQGLAVSYDFNQLQFRLNKKSFTKFIELSDIVLKNHKRILTFTWPLSTGESSLLSFYSRLFENSAYYRHDILFVIDEGDSFFHPEWSRKYIKNITTVIPKILKYAKSFQFVITTHSPFILSDIPSSNVRLLNRNNGEIEQTRPVHQTFGSNIYDLLNNGFFLNSFIGSFAESKIDAAFKTLNELITLCDDIERKELYTEKYNAFISKEKESKQIYQTIQLIGDSLIQDKLLQMYYIATKADFRSAMREYYSDKANQYKDDN